MEVKEQILKEIDRVPEEYLAQILDFILFLEAKAADSGLATAIASESSLAKDWLTPEEDEAWKHL
ncbi:MAG: DUF2281 domain-containing protein [Chloroflexi bacterium]|nr:DUF2281 domain-containing protein [Chloroflexota bacterium]